MFREVVEKKYFYQWISIAIGVLLVLALIQILRVNDSPRESSRTETYTPSGTLIRDDIQIGAQDFYSSRINLNRRTRLNGSFRSDNVKSHVSVLVMDEKNFDNWKLNSDFNAVARTGFVPGGRIGPVLGPGVYFLIIDNRRSDVPRSVSVDFSLE